MSAVCHLIEYYSIIKKKVSMIFNDMEENAYSVMLRENRIKIRCSI